METDKELKSICTCMNILQTQYLKLHDKTFKFTLRHLPIPFLFKAIDFNSIENDITYILEEFDLCYRRIIEIGVKGERSEYYDGFYAMLLYYCGKIIDAISIFKNIIHSLYLKSNNIKGYNVEEHNKLCALYNESIAKYSELTESLNYYINKLYENSAQVHFTKP